jgi:hypothetical protein
VVAIAENDANATAAAAAIPRAFISLKRGPSPSGSMT